MRKKIFAFLIALSLIFVTSSVFAANEIKDSMNKAGSSMQNMVNGAGNVIRDTGSAITNGVRNVGTAISDGASTVTRDMTRTDTTGTNNGYTATRTANDATIMGMSPNTWTWFVLAITALAIVAVVWYYAMQNKTEYTNHND